MYDVDNMHSTTQIARMYQHARIWDGDSQKIFAIQNNNQYQSKWSHIYVWKGLFVFVLRFCCCWTRKRILSVCVRVRMWCYLGIYTLEKRHYIMETCTVWPLLAIRKPGPFSSQSGVLMFGLCASIVVVVCVYRSSSSRNSIIYIVFYAFVCCVCKQQQQQQHEKWMNVCRENKRLTNNTQARTRTRCPVVELL